MKKAPWESKRENERSHILYFTRLAHFVDLNSGNRVINFYLSFVVGLLAKRAYSVARESESCRQSCVDIQQL